MCGPSKGLPLCLSKKKCSMESSPLFDKIDLTQLPRHIAIIMDGNGRWAKANSLRGSRATRWGSNLLIELLHSVEK